MMMMMMTVMMVMMTMMMMMTMLPAREPTLLLMLRSGRMRRALLVGCGLQLFQQLSGINTVM